MSLRDDLPGWEPWSDRDAEADRTAAGSCLKCGATRDRNDPTPSAGPLCDGCRPRGRHA